MSFLPPKARFPDSKKPELYTRRFVLAGNAITDAAFAKAYQEA
jgi:hypothetical protein